MLNNVSWVNVEKLQNKSFAMEVDQPNINEVFPPIPGLLSVSAMYQPYVEKLYNDNGKVVVEGLTQIKNLVIGNNKQKSNFIVLGAVPRLVYLIQHESSDISTKTHCAVILGSLAKGMEANVKSLLDYGVMDVMFYGLQQPDIKLYEACLRCIRTIVTSSRATSDLIFVDPSVVSILLDSINRSTCSQECTCEILSCCCMTKHHQDLLYNLGVLAQLAELLVSNILRVQLKALHTFSVLCYCNDNVCDAVLKARTKDRSVVSVLEEMLSRGQPVQIQLLSAKCMTYLYRSGAAHCLDKEVVYKKVLPCLVRMCDASSDIEERLVGARTLAYLIENEPKLQRHALICEQFPKKLEAYFRHPTAADTGNMADIRRFKNELGRGNELLESVFLAYAALLSNDEDMRKIVCNESLLQHLVQAMDNSSANVRIAALICLLSLSRSVQILRTTFEDTEVWKAVLKIAHKPLVPNDPSSMKEMVAVSGLLCNLLLEFSPCKTKILSANILQTIKNWCESETSPNLRRNAVWCLCNLTFQAELKLKLDVMTLLGHDVMFNLLTSTDYDVVTKTLGILNNVLTNNEHTDTVMALHGDTVMQACVVVMETTSPPLPATWATLGERDVSSAVATHALCVLNCVAAGDTGTVRKYMHENEDLLRKLVEFAGRADEELQTAAVACMYTLCESETADSAIRKEKFRALGAQDVLLKLSISASGPMAERVKSTLQLFQHKPN
uniref:armadillo repeat-containing protein 8 isoform X2 n=1 Tax=Ciona intestinalis TaxID=7719 RepID=UPI00089DC483|nr:armadillo repeat-containing protein 8 isoform X2 [Ciona intestinalis]|eukprot:XP_018668901.1 armadillo repeat-containing protein 8 isoform X2 [Ciona intestinalis]